MRRRIVVITLALSVATAIWATRLSTAKAVALITNFRPDGKAL